MQAHDRPTGGQATILGVTTIGGEPLTKRQRAIVAALVYHGPAGATTDALIDAVWTGAVPAAARQSLQNQITRLRRRFGPAVIDTDPAGYVLQRSSDVGLLDGTSATWLSRSPSPQGVAPLEAALGLWRGTPYLDLGDHLSVEPERARLVEVRSQAAEHLARCRLAAGDVRGAVRDLTALTEDEPYREARWELLMRALYLDARRGEALAAYDRAAARFARDLDVRPSLSLQLLRAEIERDLVASLDQRSADVDAAGPPACNRTSWRRRCPVRPTGHHR